MKKILLVSQSVKENSAVGEKVKEAAKKAGFQIDFEEHPQDVLNKARSGSLYKEYELVLLSGAFRGKPLKRIAGADGLTLVEKLKAWYPKNLIAIVMISSNLDYNNRGIRKGADGAIPSRYLAEDLTDKDGVIRQAMQAYWRNP